MAQLSITQTQWPLIRPFRVSHTTVSSVVVIALEARAGATTGRGQVSIGPWTDETPAMVIESARTLVTQLDLTHFSLSDVERVLEAAVTAPAGGRMLAEMTLIDLLARTRGAPAWRLLGLPQPPAHVPLWQTVPVGETTPPLLRSRIKLKLGSEHDAHAIARLRHLDARVIVDVNRGWSAETAERMAELLRDVPLVALEDPLRDRSQLWRVRAQLPGVPVLLDEGVRSLQEVVEALEQADGVNIKLLRLGGLLAARRALSLVGERGKLAMLGCYLEPPASIAYAAQLAGLATICDLDGHSFLVDAAADQLTIDATQPGLARYVPTSGESELG